MGGSVGGSEVLSNVCVGVWSCVCDERLCGGLLIGDRSGASWEGSADDGGGVDLTGVEEAGTDDDDDDDS